MIEQRGAGVVLAEDAALLEFRYDLVDEFIERGREVRRHDDVAVGAPLDEPFLQRVGDLLRPEEVVGRHEDRLPLVAQGGQEKEELVARLRVEPRGRFVEEDRRGVLQDGNGDAWYVARKDVENNTLYVVQGHEHPWLLAGRLEAMDASWVAGTAPNPGNYSAKTRYRQTDSACAFTNEDALHFNLEFPQMQWAVTPGQSAVLYDGDVCLGGGIISA